MFAGIVEEAAPVLRFDTGARPPRLVVQSGLDQSDTKVGDSIAVEGVCLTVVECHGAGGAGSAGAEIHFEVSPETLRRSTLGALRNGHRVNLERSVRLQDRIHGHFVAGHVDSCAVLRSRAPDGDCEKLVWGFEDSFADYITPKGSVSLAGISLTIGEVDGNEFATYIIPHTLAVTTLGEKSPGDKVNFEIDLLARYAVNALRGSSSRKTGITLETLQKAGFVGSAS